MSNSSKKTVKQNQENTNPKNATIAIGVTASYKEAFKAKAKAKGLSLKEYLLFHADEVINDLGLERPTPTIPVIDRTTRENLLEPIPRGPQREVPTLEKETEKETTLNTSSEKKERTKDIKREERRLQKDKRRTMLKFSGIGLFIMITIIGFNLVRKGKISQVAIVKGLIGGAIVGYFGYMFFGKNSELDKVKDVDPELLKYIPIRK